METSHRALRAKRDASRCPDADGAAAALRPPGRGTALAAACGPHERGGRAMKTSTVMATVLLSASCFAAPVRTAQENPVGHGIAALQQHQNDAPVAPPAPDVPVTVSSGPQHWQYLTLPKSHRLDRTIAPELHQQT
jgi:hypothetical protein